jgi:hypothetical protein
MRINTAHATGARIPDELSWLQLIPRFNRLLGKVELTALNTIALDYHAVIDHRPPPLPTLVCSISVETPTGRKRWLIEGAFAGNSISVIASESSFERAIRP